MSSRDDFTHLTVDQQERERFLVEFEESFRFGRLVRKLFKTANSDPIYAQSITRTMVSDAPYGSWFLVCRLPENLEERFGLTREFLVYCTDVDDLQVRALEQTQTLISNFRRSIDAELACIVVDDPRAPEKLRDWAFERTTGLTVIPITLADLQKADASSQAALELPRILSEWLFSRNLYDERNPVTGSRFFGRDKEKGMLQRTVRDGRHAGVFGLRKAGKTSLLHELRASIRRDATTTLAAYVDLQGSAATASAAHVAFVAGTELIRESTASDSTADITPVLAFPRRWDANAGPIVLARFLDGLREWLSEVDNAGPRRVCLILDEIEVLLRDDPPFQLAVEFLSGLRAVSQQTGRLSIVLAGVNATICERPTLSRADNPLFGLVEMLPLGPLDDADAKDLVSRIGKKMGLRWNGEARDALVQRAGRYPMLVRLGASDVATLNPERPRRIEIADVSRVMGAFHTHHTEIFREMTESLLRYYPDEFELLRIIAEGDRELAMEWQREYPQAANHLRGFGIVDLEDARIVLPVFEDWLAAYGGSLA